MYVCLYITYIWYVLIRMYASSSWKGLMYVAVAVGNIQGKSGFTVSEGELRNSTVAEGGMLVSNKSSVKR